MPNFIRGVTYISHSAKGSVWEDHKYVKKVDGNYYYPNGYEGGRQIKTLKGVAQTAVKKAADSAKSLNSGATQVPSTQQKRSPREIADENYYNDLQKKMEKELDALIQKGPGYFNGQSQEEAKKKIRDTIAQLKAQAAASRSKMSETLNAKKNEVAIDVDDLARRVLRGEFGNGDERKQKLGANYEAVQNRVNELSKKSGGNSKSSKKVEKLVSDNATKKLSAKDQKVVDRLMNNLSNQSDTKKKKNDLDDVYAVYDRKKKRKK